MTEKVRYKIYCVTNKDWILYSTEFGPFILTEKAESVAKTE